MKLERLGSQVSAVKPYIEIATTAADKRDGLELAPDYEPGDGEAEARVLMMILGLPSDEIERVVSELSLDSQLEM